MNPPLERAGDNEKLNLSDNEMMEVKMFDSLVIKKRKHAKPKAVYAKQAEYCAVRSEWARNINKR